MKHNKENHVITGYHAIEELLKSRRTSYAGELYIELGAKRAEKLKELAAKVKVRCITVSGDELRRMAGPGVRHEAYVVKAAADETPGQPAGTSRKQSGGAHEYANVAAFLDSVQSEDSLVIALDGVTDPHNLGAVLRSAEQFGAEAVMLPERRSAHVNETVAKTSAGAVSHVSVLHAPNLARALGELKEAGFWIYGAEAGGTPLSSCSFSGRVVLVLGSEGKGMGRLVRENCDELIAIPMLGNLDSLNVSVACGILCYEVRRSQGRFA